MVRGKKRREKGVRVGERRRRKRPLESNPKKLEKRDCVRKSGRIAEQEEVKKKESRDSRGERERERVR